MRHREPCQHRSPRTRPPWCSVWGRMALTNGASRPSVTQPTWARTAGSRARHWLLIVMKHAGCALKAGAKRIVRRQVEVAQRLTKLLDENSHERLSSGIGSILQRPTCPAYPGRVRRALRQALRKVCGRPSVAAPGRELRDPGRAWLVWALMAASRVTASFRWAIASPARWSLASSRSQAPTGSDHASGDVSLARNSARYSTTRSGRPSVSYTQ